MRRRSHSPHLRLLISFSLALLPRNLPCPIYLTDTPPCIPYHSQASQKNPTSDQDLDHIPESKTAFEFFTGINWSYRPWQLRCLIAEGVHPLASWAFECEFHHSPIPVILATRQHSRKCCIAWVC